MKKSTYTLFGLAAVALVLSDAGAQDSQDGAAAKPPILVVDFTRAVEESAEYRELIATKETEKAKMLADFQEKVAKVKRDQEDLSKKTRLSERGADFYERLERALLAEGELRAAELVFNQRVGDDVRRRREALHIEVGQIAAEVARERGALAVLASKSGPVQFETEDNIRDELVMRRVLWAAPGVDVTDEVLKRLNERHEARKKKARGSGGEGGE